jgi:hypothetical protein
VTEEQNPLEPVVLDVQRWFAELDRFMSEPFMPDGRNQPVMPTREDMFD